MSTLIFCFLLTRYPFAISNSMLLAYFSAPPSPGMPSTLSKLDSFVSAQHSLEPGNYLIAVLGANFMVKSSLSITAVPITDTAADAVVADLKTVDDQLYAKKHDLEQLQTRYLAATAEMEQCNELIKKEEEALKELLTSRGEAYNSFFAITSSQYAPSSPGKVTSSIIETAETTTVIADAENIDVEERERTPAEKSDEKESGRKIPFNASEALGGAANVAANVTNTTMVQATAALGVFSRTVSQLLCRILDGIWS